MKKITTFITLRAAMAVALCLIFVLCPPVWISTATTITPFTDVKSESQLRAEASRYDAAIRAIAGIAAMKFDKPEDLKKAVVILDRERPSLRLFRSKLVVIGLSDTTFVSAARKKLPDKEAAEAFAQKLIADSKVAFTVDGAAALKTRIQQSIQADSATLRRAGEQLKAASAKFKKAQAPQTPAGEFRIIKAGFSYSPRDTEVPETPALDPASIAVIVVAVIAYSAIIYLGLKWYGPRFGIGTEEDKDQVADCQQVTDSRYARCVDEARDLPAGFPLFLREAAEAGCYGDWLIRQAGCLALII